MNTIIDNGSDLVDIEEVKPFSEEDKKCFEELRAVLEKHGNLKRFGITLMHKHFILPDDEVLVEESDPKSNTQRIIPTKRSEVPADVTIVNWRLDKNCAMPPLCRLKLRYC